MADVRDWGAFIRGRWDWHRFEYDKGFPRSCQFSDIDAATEFDGQALVIEPKHHDGFGPCPYPENGQLGLLRDDVRRGKTVFVLYGCATCNSPQALRILGSARADDKWLDWRGRDIEERRKLFKEEIDRAVGLAG